MARFYRTRRSEKESSIYIQEEDYWRTVSPEGGAADHPGKIPPGFLQMLEEITGDEAASILARRRARPSHQSAVLAPEVRRARTEPSGWTRAGKALGGAIVVIAVIAYAIYQLYPLLTTDGEDRQSWEKAESIAQEADEARGSGRYEEAISLYDEAISVDAGFGHAYYSKMYALMEKRDFSAAEAWARKVTERFPSSHEGWFGLGYALEFQGEIDPAIAAYEKGLPLARDYENTIGAIEAGNTLVDMLSRFGQGEPPDAGPTKAMRTTDLGLVASIEKRLALLRYMGAALTPRKEARLAMEEFLSLTETADNPNLVLTHLAETRSVISATIHTLSQASPPVHLAAYHSEILGGYRELLLGLTDLSNALSEGSFDEFAAAGSRVDAAGARINEADQGLEALLDTYWD